MSRTDICTQLGRFRMGGGKSAKTMRAEQQTAIDQTPITTRCAFCKWTHVGTALEGRELAKTHRKRKHPEAKQTRRRKGGSLMRHVTSDDSYRAEALVRAKKVAAGLAKLEEAS
jgi:hypothetical protein